MFRASRAADISYGRVPRLLSGHGRPERMRETLAHQFCPYRGGYQSAEWPSEISVEICQQVAGDTRCCAPPCMRMAPTEPQECRTSVAIMPKQLFWYAGRYPIRSWLSATPSLDTPAARHLDQSNPILRGRGPVSDLRARIFGTTQLAAASHTATAALRASRAEMTARRGLCGVPLRGRSWLVNMGKRKAQDRQGAG